MANHSAANPEGRLDKDVLKSFFAITGEPGSFKNQHGYERIPNNWYRRAVGDEYTIPYFSSDLNAAGLQHPEFFSTGGNLGKTDTYTAVNPANLTGGVYTTQNIAQGNNAACFAYQAAVLLAPDLLKGGVQSATAVVNALANVLPNTIGRLNCPQLQKFDPKAYQQFPGYTQLKADGTYP